MQTLLTSRSISPRFDFPFDLEQTIKALTAAYTAEVHTRGRECQIDNELEDNIRQVAVWMTGKGKGSLLLMGNVGDGKTTMMRAIRRVVHGAEIYKVTPDKFELTHMLITTARELSEGYCANGSAYFDKVLRNDIIGIDDMGAEPAEMLVYGNPINAIADLICEAYEKQSQCVITTNLRADELRPRYGARVADRMNEMFDRVFFRFNTYRTYEQTNNGVSGVHTANRIPGDN